MITLADGRKVVPLCSSWDLTEDYGTPILLWIGACAPTWFLSVENLSDALDEAASWASENAPGLLTEPEYLPCAGQEGSCGKHEGTCWEATEAAEVDLSCCDMGLWVASWEWGCADPDADTLEAAQAWAQAEEETAE
jgi:hypothetical protein